MTHSLDKKMRLSFTQIIEAQLLELRSSELQQIRAIMKTGDQKDLLAYLEQNGWKEFKKGRYSKVYSRNNSPYIIKVMGDSLDMKGDPRMRGALQWLRYSQKNHLSNPYLPKVYYVQTMEGTPSQGEDMRIYLIVMEKLERVQQDDYKKVLMSGKTSQERAYTAASMLIHDTLSKRHMDTRRLNTTAMLLLWEYVTKNMSDEEKSAYEVNTRDISSVFEEAVAFGFPLALAMKLVDKMNYKGSFNDLHDENVMKRPGTGELVINDPFVG
jgi:hypothetical protein